MNKISLAIAALVTVAFSVPSAFAQSAKPISLGISAGAAIPVGDLGDDYSTGYNGTVSLGFQSIGSPIGFRIDGMYNKLGVKSDRVVQLPDITITSANANIVYTLPGVGIRPYLIGGGGIYGYKFDISGADTNTDFGVNGGIGASFPLSGFTTFVEARYHHIFTEGTATQFIPVTFGISF
ncbi:MAG: outer membrane beta-barrel protein [Gemmatimonadaceae bacterium]